MTQDRTAKGTKKIPVKSKGSDRVVWVTPETLKKEPGKYQQVKQQPKAPPPPAGSKAAPPAAPKGKPAKKQPPPIPEHLKKKPEAKPEPQAKPQTPEHGAHEDAHSVKPKKSWGQTLKGLGESAQKFLASAPKAVQTFVTDPAVRKQAITEGVKGVKGLPKKLGSNLLQTCKDEVKEFKTAHEGVRAVMSGKKMSKHQQHAFRTVATHLAIGVAAAAFTATSPLAGAGAFAKGLARHIAAKSVHRSLEKAHLLDELGHIGHGIQHILTASDEQPPQPQGPDEAERAMMKLIMYSVSKELGSLTDEDLVQVLNSMSENDTDEDEGQPEEAGPQGTEPPPPQEMAKEARVLTRFLKNSR